MRTSMTLVLAAALLSATACDLDLENPNAPTDEEVAAELDGVLTAAVGMQQQFASDIEAFVQAPALTTDEWGTTTLAFTSYQSLLTGNVQQFDAAAAVVEEPFAAAYQTIVSANFVLDNAPSVIEGAGLRAGVTSLAKLYKAMSYGMIIQQYSEVPIDIRVETPVPQPRGVVLDTVIALLESARQDLAGVSEADLAGFEDRVLGSGFDVANTIDAMLARYYLIVGNNQAAITAAERVDLSVTSEFTYTATTPNPIRNLSLGLGYVQPLASFVSEAEAGDERVDYWVDTSVEPMGGNPPDTLLLPLNQYSELTDPFPVYLPDEMRLIQAEAYTRMGGTANFDLARELINEVRTAGAVPLANLPPLPETALDTEDELLEQIAYERRYELYEQGLRWEDARRLDAQIDTEPTFDFLPLPRQECLTNPEAGC